MTTLIIILIIYVILSGAGLFGIMNPDEDVILHIICALLAGWFIFPIIAMICIGKLIYRYY